jgi:DNA-binding NarL/FixJ family response regulator
VIRVLFLDRLRTFGDVLARSLAERSDLDVLVMSPTGDIDPSLLTHGSSDVAVVSCDIARDLAATLRPGDTWGGAPHVVVLGDLTDSEHAPEMFRRGASGWVDRSASIDELARTIHAADQGETRLPPRLLTGLMAELAERPRPDDERYARVARLTPRELQIMQMIARGLGRREIAAQLHLSPNTVRTHVQSILSRLEVHSTLAAVALVRGVAVPVGSPMHVEPHPSPDVDAIRRLPDVPPHPRAAR